MSTLNELMKECLELLSEMKVDTEQKIARGVTSPKVAENKIISAGEHFTYKGIEFVCIDITDNRMLAVTAKIVKSMRFSYDGGEGSNDWKTSFVRDWLNGEFLKRFDANDLVMQTSDLTADNGDDTYGTSHEYIALLSCDQYRKYRKLMPRYDNFVWTLTPTCCSDGYAHDVRLIYECGVMDSSVAVSKRGLVPVCTFNLDRLELRRPAYLVATESANNWYTDNDHEEE